MILLGPCAVHYSLQVNTLTSASHCGSCGTSCAITGDDSCSSGLCYNSTRDCGECYTRPVINGLCFSNTGSGQSVRFDFDTSSGSYKMSHFFSAGCSASFNAVSCSTGVSAADNTQLINRGSGCCTVGGASGLDIRWTPGANCNSLTMYASGGGSCDGSFLRTFTVNPAPFKTPSPEC
jgi:hypothetical protein